MSEQSPPPVIKGMSAQTPEGDVTGGVIPYKNLPALFGYYLGVFSLIPCLGLPLGIAAIICGIIGHSKASKQPHLHGTAHAWVAIILGSMTTLLWIGSIVWMFLWMANPSKF